MEMTIEQLYAEHRGKLSDKWSLYLPEYDRLLAPYRKRSVRILEIGIQNGGSLEIWQRAFPQAVSIVGCDINPDCARLQYSDPRISVIVGDANTDEVTGRIQALSPGFDIIIDDGSHRSHDIIQSFARYFPLLADGGLFIAEDLHCSYWRDYEGGLFFPFSSVAFFKRLADVVNHEHWGNGQPHSAVLRSFGAAYGINFGEEMLKHVHAVEFANSMCSVRKMAPADNTAGRRVIVGTEETVTHGHRVLHGSPFPTIVEANNEWANRGMLPEEELLLRIQQVTELQQTLAERDRQIARLSQALSECGGQKGNPGPASGAQDA